eukprot:scaffold1665_cov149-Skeletonema_menzelii.AAC.1
MPSSPMPPIRRGKSAIATALTLSSLVLASFTLNEDYQGSLHTPANNEQYDRQLLEVNSSIVNEKYSTLQDINDIDQSIERRAKATATASAYKCDNMLLYLPDMDHFSAHGHGSQINTYIVSVLTGTYLNRNVLILDPPNDKSSYAGASQFGCPVDAFEENQMQSKASSSDSWQVKEDFPGGLSRLIDQPTWLSGGCPIPCADTYTYNDWVRFARSPTAFKSPITCIENGQTVNVIATSGRGVRNYFNSLDQFVSSEGWAMKLGATSDEAKIFSTLSGTQMWDYAVGLMNKAGFMRLQPWIARDVEVFIQSFGLKDEAYDAIHVRRGDKLIKEARGQVMRYWSSQGHRGVAPTNYIPFVHYLDQFKKAECPLNEHGEVERMKRIVYVATDDPVVVKKEIADLPHHIDESTILWNGCHELSFYFNPTKESGFHLNGDGERGFLDGSKDNCFDSGEFNSNWGRLLRTMRVRLRDSGDAEYSKTLDMRIAWGVMQPRLPGW